MFYIWAEGLPCFSSQTYLIVINPPPTHPTSHLVQDTVSFILWLHDFLQWLRNKKVNFYFQYPFLFNFLRLLMCYKRQIMPPSKAFLKKDNFWDTFDHQNLLLVFCQVFRVSCFDVASVLFFHVFRYFSFLISLNLSRCIIWFWYL